MYWNKALTISGLTSLVAAMMCVLWKSSKSFLNKLGWYLVQVLNHPPAHRSNKVSEVEPSKSIEIVLSIPILHRLLQTNKVAWTFLRSCHLQRDPRDLAGSAPNQPGPQSLLLLLWAVQPFLVFKAKRLVAVEASLVPLNDLSEMSGFCGVSIQVNETQAVHSLKILLDDSIQELLSNK